MKPEAKLIVTTMQRHLKYPKLLTRAEQRFRKITPEGQKQNVDLILIDKRVSYRDGLMIQLAYALCARAQLDLTRRPEGARGIAGMLGKFLAANHIPAVQDAYQNIAKNAADLARGNVPQFDSFLKWGSEASREQLLAAFEYTCARVASTSRPVLCMPVLDQAKLSFAAVLALFKTLFLTPSEGAHEQFAIAALLHALLQQIGIANYRVQTKSLNASDKSSRAAGDIQILTGNRVVEAYEITSKDWESKLPGAAHTIRANDLSRLHVVAKLTPSTGTDLVTKLSDLRDDVSVLDVEAFAASLIATLTRSHRAVALQRLYEFLDRYQPVIGRVNDYVQLLQEMGLVMRS